MTLEILLSVFIFGSLLNFPWEYFHSRLYTTCHGMPKQELSNLLVKQSLKDGFFITLFYLVTVLFVGNFIFNNILGLIIFSLICLLFSFFDEYVSIRMGRWEYAKSMPMFLGVGLTPLLEVAITGLLSLFITSLLF